VFPGAPRARISCPGKLSHAGAGGLPCCLVTSSGTSSAANGRAGEEYQVRARYQVRANALLDRLSGAGASAGVLSSTLGVARCGRSAGCVLCALWVVPAAVLGGGGGPGGGGDIIRGVGLWGGGGWLGWGRGGGGGGGGGGTLWG